MNIYDIIKGDGTTEVPNPKYNRKSKKNIEPPTIKVPDNYADNDDVINFALKGMMEENAVDAKIADKYRKYGINFSYKEPELDRQLAEAQSNFDKTKNAIAQTIVSEIGLGTLRGITDLFDGIYNLATRQENDYTSPASEKLKQWQEEFEAYAPVHVAPGTDISNGGLLDWGWWMSNMPSIASSLTLLIPSTGFTKAVGYVGKGLRVGKGVSSARKFLTRIDKLDKAVDAGKELNAIQKVGRWANNKNTIESANRMFEFGLNGFTSRILENYQESNQVYNDLLPQLYEGDRDNNIEGIKDMSDADYNALIERNRDVLNGVDTDNRREVAKRLAKKAADLTFKDDLVNGLFDVYQLYGLRNLKALKNAPMRASVRRKHLNSMRYPGKSEAEIKEILDKRSKWAKGWETAKDYAWGAKRTFLSEASEGIEEAINYIAQEEGYTYGHVLLGTEDKRNFWDDKLREYMMAPQLYESAFWGVMGGAVFQGAGSALAGVDRAIKRKKNEKRHALDETTKEQIARTSWSEAFESDEIRTRKANIEARVQAEHDLRQELADIQDGKDPWTGVKNLDTKEDKEIAREKAYDKRITNLLFNAMTVGNWKITRAYLESDKVKQGLVEAGIVTQEQADEMQERAIELASQIETLYNANLRAIGNAMRGTDEVTGVDYEKVPIEYFQIIAAENTKNQLEAERFNKNIEAYQPVINSEEARLKDEIEQSGIDYKASIRAFILSKQLGEIQADIDAAKKTIEEGRTKDNIDLRTISGQNALKKLEIRKQVLMDMLYNQKIDPNDKLSQKAIKTAKILTAARAMTATESNGEGGYNLNVQSKKYRDLDAAIVNAAQSTEENWDANRAALALALPGYGFENFTLSEFQTASRQADVFNEKLGAAFGVDNAIENLDKLSTNLLNAYAQIVHNEVARNVSLYSVAKDRDSIIKLAHNKYNDIRSARGVAIEAANHSLKAIAKKYFDEYGDISESLAYGTLREADRNRLKDILSDEDFKIYDNMMQILSLNSKNVTGRDKATQPLNVLLPELVRDAVRRSSLDGFEEVTDELIEEETNEERETNAVNQNQSSASQTSQVNSSSSQAQQANTQSDSGEKIDFSINKSGGAVADGLRAIVVFDDNGRVIRLEQFGQITDEEHQHDVKLVPVEGQSNTYELDYKHDLTKYSDTNPFEKTTSGQLFNIKQSIIDGGTITRNPRVVINDDGTVTNPDRDFVQGEIKNPESLEEDSEDVEGDNAFISSTDGFTDGSETQSEIKPDPTEEAPTELFDATPQEVANSADDELGYTSEDAEIENIKAEMNEAALFYLRDNIDNASVQGFEKQLEEKYRDKLSEQEFEEASKQAIEVLKRNAEEFEIELKNIADFVQQSALFDKTPSDQQEAVKKELDTIFKRIIDDYLTRAYIEEKEVDGRTVKVISLENLLRYTNAVTGGTELGSALFDRFVKYLRLNTTEYEILEKKPRRDISRDKNKIIQNAAKTSQEKFDLDNPVDGNRIDISYVLYQIDQSNLSDEEKKAKKEEIYDVIDNLKPGDNVTLQLTDNGRGLQFVVNGVVIASNAVPFVSKDGSYRMINAGWITDIPRERDGSVGRLQNLFTRIMLNPDNEAKLKPITRRLVSLLNEKSRVDGKPNLKLVDALRALNTVVPLDEYIQADINSDEDCLRLYNHVRNIYRHAYTVRQTWLAEKGISAQRYAELIKNKQAKSIANWFERLRNSYETTLSRVDAINNTGQNVVQINHLFKGGVVITSPKEQLPCNAENALGSKHRPIAQIAVASISEAGIVHVSDGHDIQIPNVVRGTTHILIPREQGTPALIPAYPQPIGASTLSESIQNITDDVFKELDRLLDVWGSNVNISTNAIKDFLNKLTSPMRDAYGRPSNNPLFRGIKVTSLTGNFKGINIAYKENGVFKNIKLFDEVTVNGQTYKASNIRFGVDRAQSLGKKVNRNKIKNQLREVLSQAITFNIEFDHVKGSADISGFAYRGNNGEFIIKIGENGKIHKFDSYRSFILDNGVVNIRSKSINGKTNFYRSFGQYSKDSPQDSDNQLDFVNITFTTPQEWNEQKQSSSPVEENDEVVLTSKGDKVKNLIAARGSNTNIGAELANIMLNSTRLKLLKNSRLLKDILLTNVIFVHEFEDAIAAHLNADTVRLDEDVTIDGRQLLAGSYVPVSSLKGKVEYNGTVYSKGSILVTQKLINLLNSDNVDEHEQAFRHLVHEAVHKRLATLSKEKRNELFDSIRDIFNTFVETNKRDNVDEWVRRFEYEKDWYKDENGKDKRRYHKEDGTINNAGLEEFLVESLTRPEVINRLNSISVDGNRITKQKIGNIKSKSLLQRILAAIAKIFDINLNKGSLIEKEYKLLSQVGFDNSNNEKTKKETTNKKQTEQKVPKVLTLPFKEDEEQSSEPKEEKQKPESIESKQEAIVKRNVKDQSYTDSGEEDFDSDERLSTMYDKPIDKPANSVAEVRDAIISANRDKFDRFINSGIIEIKC